MHETGEYRHPAPSSEENPQPGGRAREPGGEGPTAAQRQPGAQGAGVGYGAAMGPQGWPPGAQMGIDPMAQGHLGTPPYRDQSAPGANPGFGGGYPYPMGAYAGQPYPGLYGYVMGPMGQPFIHGPMGYVPAPGVMPGMGYGPGSVAGGGVMADQASSHPHHGHHHRAPSPAAQMFDELFGQGGNPGRSAGDLVSWIGLDDKEFWKGALIGAAVVLLLTNETVKNALFKTGAAVKDKVSSGVEAVKEVKETMKKTPKSEKGAPSGSEGGAN